MSAAHRAEVYGPPGSDWEEQLARLSTYEGLASDRAALDAHFRECKN